MVILDERGINYWEIFRICTGINADLESGLQKKTSAQGSGLVDTILHPVSTGHSLTRQSELIQQILDRGNDMQFG